MDKPLRHTSKAFWGEMSPCEHAVQIYGSDSAFMDTLEGFVLGGLEAHEVVIVIATEEHRGNLHHRLINKGLSVSIAIAQGAYVPLDAEDTMAKFMVDGWPDEDLFKEVIEDLLRDAAEYDRKVRAFGEMVALMWAAGQNGATVRLEFLWHQLCQERDFSLFCAYPRCGFTQNAEASMKEICDAHSRVIPWQ